ncbi:uncharacterized protein LOC135843415 [Planococcus citri]|uniref:uncharacterized protein LOC135843415 n=1 Tax=Planococcus citri TaxID=170843 RepID=UPI0031F9F1BD
MKLTSLLICGFAFLESFVVGHLDLSDDDGDGVVGVSQKNLVEYVTKALNGFKYVMLKGDEELNYPIMDPYALEDISWEHTDSPSSNKYSLKFLQKNEPVNINGLSNYRITGVDVDAKDMRLTFNIVFSNLRTEIPYKLDGYLFKGVMPVYGEGLLKFSAPTQRLNIMIDLDIENGFIIVDDVRVHRYKNNIDIDVTGFMDLSDKFANTVLDDILHNIIINQGIKELQKFVRNKVEEAVGGMTMEELFGLLEHFVKKEKNDKQ